MRYLKFTSSSGATQRSRQLWEEHLGRPKNLEDETEFLYSWQESESSEGGSYLLIHDEGALLTSAEIDALENEDSYQQWRREYQPQDCADELAEENS